MYIIYMYIYNIYVYIYIYLFIYTRCHWYDQTKVPLVWFAIAFEKMNSMGF